MLVGVEVRVAEVEQVLGVDGEKGRRWCPAEIRERLEHAIRERAVLRQIVIGGVGASARAEHVRRAPAGGSRKAAHRTARDLLAHAGWRWVGRGGRRGVQWYAPAGRAGDRRRHRLAAV